MLWGYYVKCHQDYGNQGKEVQCFSLVLIKSKRKLYWCYVDSAETLMLHSCLGKTKVVVALNITFEIKVYKAVVHSCKHLI